MNWKGDAPTDAWMGWSRGRWEGDTLVVDVTGQREETWFDRAGDFHSDALHVVERYTPVSPYHLMYEATIEDPKVYTRPWKISFPLYRRMEKNVQLLEFKCVPFTEELLYGKFRKSRTEARNDASIRSSLSGRPGDRGSRALPAIAGQAPSAEADRAAKARRRRRKREAAAQKAWTPTRTPWGDPDLQGVWNDATSTPLQRPSRAGGKGRAQRRRGGRISAADGARVDPRSPRRRAPMPTSTALTTSTGWTRGG